MANWSQSHFLQALGWAILNSLWQMALLWCIYMGAGTLLRISSHRKYQLSVVAIMTGFVWFLLTLIYYLNSSSASAIAFFNQTIRESNSLLNILLLSASIAYLSLLCFPSYRLFRNWQFVQRIRKFGLHKADLNYRLFVGKISEQLGIGKKVRVYISELVNSPVTVGYLKPIILLPLAAFNNLSTQQVEAILLHELSHIRRYDYLVNFLLSIISTLLYFNPFIKQFMKAIEEERENCCDELVLQFGYDKVSYATALLTLEKLSARQQVLAIGAAGKNYLISRIEKIVGMEKKKGLKRNQLAGILAALFCIILFNSILIIKEKKQNNYAYAFTYTGLSNPFNMFEGSMSSHRYLIEPASLRQNLASTASRSRTAPETAALPVTSEPSPWIAQPAEQNMFQYVALDEIDAALSTEEKNKVKATVDATKKVVSTLQWNEVEKNIADAMNEQEKEKARQEYLTALDQTMNWKNVERKMKAQYENLDWNRININVKNALTAIHLDSLEKNYKSILVQLDKANTEVCAQSRVSLTPLPDQSVEEIRKSREVLRRTVDSIQVIRNPRKVVRL